MKQALLITGGTINREFMSSIYERITNACFVLGVDGGCQSAMDANIPLDAIIGDFDTLDINNKKILMDSGVEAVTLNPIKNITDTHAAFEYLFAHDYTHVTIIGGIGTRLDHSLANLMLAFHYLSKMQIEFLDVHNRMRPFIGPIVVKGKKNERFKYLSIIPIEETLVIQTQGLKYPVNNEIFKVYDSYGVSNEIKEDSSYSIEFGKGKFFLVESND